MGAHAGNCRETVSGGTSSCRRAWNVDRGLKGHLRSRGARGTRAREEHVLGGRVWPLSYSRLATRGRSELNTGLAGCWDRRSGRAKGSRRIGCQWSTQAPCDGREQRVPMRAEQRQHRGSAGRQIPRARGDHRTPLRREARACRHAGTCAGSTRVDHARRRIWRVCGTGRHRPNVRCIPRASHQWRRLGPRPSVGRSWRRADTQQTGPWCLAP